jgi:NRPS condensation-like uncharacterized protein
MEIHPSQNIFSDGTSAAEPEQKTHSLRLSPFDVLMLLDERPGYPMCFFIETQLSGDFSTHRLRVAVETAIKRHPRLRSHAQYDEQGWFWTPSDKPPQIVQLEQIINQESRAIAFRPFNIRQEPGIRFIVIPEGNQQWSIVLQVHHSVCDGLAALEFLGDTWSLYHGNEPTDFQTHSRKKSIQTDPDIDVNQNIKEDHQHARQTIAFATFRPSSIASSSNTKKIPHSRKPFQSFTLPPTLVKSLRQRASQSGATTNDIIVAASILTIHEWNRRQGQAGKRIRITMPVSLRPPRERQPASNQIGYAFLDRHPNQLHDPLAAVTSIAEASRWIQHSGAAGMFLVVLGVFLNRTWLLRLILRLPTCFSTAVVSNIGNVQSRMRANVPKADGCNNPGGLIITNITGVPPVRPGTALSVGITAYSGQITITTMIDSSQLTPNDGVLLTALLQSQIKSFVV